MANELFVSHKTGETLHGMVRDVLDGNKVWQTTTSTFVTYVDGNKANYAITMTEDSGGSSYVGSFPIAISTAKRYGVQILDANDIEHYFGWIWWTGTEEEDIPRRLRIR